MNAFEIFGNPIKVIPFVGICVFRIKIRKCNDLFVKLSLDCRGLKYIAIIISDLQMVEMLLFKNTLEHVVELITAWLIL